MIPFLLAQVSSELEAAKMRDAPRVVALLAGLLVVDGPTPDNLNW
jgi:hypothetical protein